MATMEWISIDGRPADGATPTAAGLYDIEASLAAGRRARFTLALPAGGAQPGQPLVLVLHYAGQPTRFYGRPLLAGLVAPALVPLGAVMVAPESLGGPWHEEGNEAFVLGLVDDLAARYGSDPGRRALCGYSMGALGTWHLLVHYPERFSAAVPIAGYPQRADLACAIPVHALHAASDELFPLPPLEAAVAAARARGCPLELSLAEVHGHYDVNGYGPALAALVPWFARTWSR